MKFGNRCWRQREGIECFAPQEAYFVNQDEREVIICAPTHHIEHSCLPTQGFMGAPPTVCHGHTMKRL